MLVDEQMRECVGFIGVDTDKRFRLTTPPRSIAEVTFLMISLA
jgi:hypothetical protein